MDYKEILKGIVNIINTTEKSDIGFANICNYIGENCPELAESDDERIRKRLICGMNALKDQKNETFAAIPIDDCIIWLEKQGKKPKKVSIWKHWKDGIAGGAEGEQIFLIKIGRVYSISSCLGCECDYIVLSELDKLMREEKQGKLKWTDEDDYNVLCCIAKAERDITNGYLGRNKELIEWLNSIKQRLGGDDYERK